MGDVIRFPQPAPLTDRDPGRGTERDRGPGRGAERDRDPGRGADRDPRPAPLWREAVGQQLREERLGQERTLADVAGDAGVSTQYLSEVERGRKEPSSEVIEAVGGALGLSLVDLTARVTRRLLSAHRTPRGPLALAA